MSYNARRFIGKADENGRLPKPVQEAIRGIMKRMAGKLVEIEVEEAEELHSAPQRRYYRKVIIGVVMEMFRDAGRPVDKDSAHKWVQLHICHWTEEVTGPDGVKIVQARTTRRKPKNRWEEDNHAIVAWLADWGYVVPPPYEKLPELPENFDN